LKGTVEAPDTAPDVRAQDAAMRRQTLLEECAAKSGALWAESLCEALRREQRPVAGGFPGTIPEARARVATELQVSLSRLRLSPIEPEELSRAVAIAYARARRDWLEVGREAKLLLAKSARQQ